MKLKSIFFIALVVLSFSIVKAQNVASAEIQAKFCKDWKITAYEMFGTVNQLEENEKADHMVFNKDFTCTTVEHGIETKATWLPDRGMQMITVIPSNKHRRIYKIVTSSDKEMTLLYQDSVLIKRTYHLSAN